MAAIQIIIYAGAIMVLFLFVVMLLNAPQEDTDHDVRAHPLLQARARCVRRGPGDGVRRRVVVGADAERRGGPGPAAER